MEKYLQGWFVLFLVAIFVVVKVDTTGGISIPQLQVNDQGRT